MKILQLVVTKTWNVLSRQSCTLNIKPRTNFLQFENTTYKNLKMASSVASATVRAVKGKRLIPTRAALVLTQAAVEKVQEILNQNSDAIGLRIGVRQRGCNGLSYVIDYASEKSKLDEEVLQDGVRIIIDKKAQLSLLGTEMDYVESKLATEFVFNNPNIKGTCGCGESFSV